jgi:hypothetical protein
MSTTGDTRHFDGVAVHVAGTGPAVVLLHANGGSHHDFAAVADAISRYATVYSVDWPGHGESALSTTPSACGFADLLPGLLDAIADGPYTLIGNSLGGFAAVRTAAQRPDLVARLVLVNPGGFTPRSPLTLGVCRLFGTPRFAPTVMRLLPHLYLRRRTVTTIAIRSALVEASHDPDRVRTFAHLWRSFTDRRHDARADATAVNSPTLLVWGTRDPVLPWITDGRRARRALPLAEAVTFGCGHQAFAEQPEEFLEALRRFIDSRPIATEP